MGVSPIHCKHKYTGSQRGIELRKTHEITLISRMEDDRTMCWSPTMTAILLKHPNPWLDAKTLSSIFSSYSLSMLLASHILTSSIHVFRRDIASSCCSRSLLSKNTYLAACHQPRSVQRDGVVGLYHLMDLCKECVALAPLRNTEEHRFVVEKL